MAADTRRRVVVSPRFPLMPVPVPVPIPVTTPSPTPPTPTGPITLSLILTEDGFHPATRWPHAGYTPKGHTIVTRRATQAKNDQCLRRRRHSIPAPSSLRAGASPRLHWRSDRMSATHADSHGAAIGETEVRRPASRGDGFATRPVLQGTLGMVAAGHYLAVGHRPAPARKRRQRDRRRRRRRLRPAAAQTAERRHRRRGARS